MAHRRGVKFSRPARLGLFAIVAIALLAFLLYLFSNWSGRGNVYRIGVHFSTAAGLAPGAQVFFSGVNVGTVSKIGILPDNSVEVIMTLSGTTAIPKRSKFTVNSSFTGGSSIAITPPRPQLSGSPQPVPSSELLPKRVLPVNEQPVGTTPLSIEDLMRQGLAVAKRGQTVMDLAHASAPRVLADVQQSKNNAAAIQVQMRTALPAILGPARRNLQIAQAQLQEASAAVRTRDRAKIAALAGALQPTAKALSASAASLKSVARDPRARANMKETAEQLRAVSANLAAVSGIMKNLADSAQTKAELRDAGLQFRAVMQKALSLLAQLH